MVSYYTWEANVKPNSKQTAEKIYLLRNLREVQVVFERVQNK